MPAKDILVCSIEEVKMPKCNPAFVECRAIGVRLRPLSLPQSSTPSGPSKARAYHYFKSCLTLQVQMPRIESDESDYSGEGSGVSEDVPEERLKVVIRARGNPRGRPKGSGSGTGRPRGRPKGSTNRIKLTVKRPPTPSDDGVDFEEDPDIPADSPAIIEPRACLR
jgi:hypothetical protein